MLNTFFRASSIKTCPHFARWRSNKLPDPVADRIFALILEIRSEEALMETIEQSAREPDVSCTVLNDTPAVFGGIALFFPIALESVFLRPAKTPPPIVDPISGDPNFPAMVFQDVEDSMTFRCRLVVRQPAIF